MRVRLIGLAISLLVPLVPCGCSQGSSAQSQEAPTTPAPVDASSDIDATVTPATGDASSPPSSSSDGPAPAPADGGTEAGTETGTGCGTRAGMRGLTHRSLLVGGLTRTYLVYLPVALEPTTPVPFVYVFHGYTMSGQEMYDITQYASLADREGIAVVFPDGEGGPDSLAAPWNVENAGQTVCGAGQEASANGDDFAFVDAIQNDVTNDQCIDAAHAYSVGFSMGAYFTEHIGCYRGDFRGLAPHSGGTLADLSACTTGHVPIILFHGTSDSVIDDACDDPTVPADVGFPAAASLWARKNGCAATYSTIAADGAGGGAGQCYLYDGCPADGQVELCTFTGMDHCWAGGTAAGTGASSACPSYSSATELQWSFFKTYAW